MKWTHVTVLLACLLSVITCGLHAACVAVLPQIVTLVTFISGGIIGIIQGGDKPTKVIHAPAKAKDASDVTNH